MIIVETEYEVRQAAEAKVAALEPAAASWSVLASADGDYSVREAAYILNRDPAIDTDQRRLFALLREWHLIDRSYTYEGEEMPADPQVRITAAGLRYLHRRMGGTVALDTNAIEIEKVRRP